MGGLGFAKLYVFKYELEQAVNKLGLKGLGCDLKGLKEAKDFKQHRVAARLKAHFSPSPTVFYGIIPAFGS